jgi:hypothetical protein
VRTIHLDPESTRHMKFSPCAEIIVPHSREHIERKERLAQIDSLG